MNITILKFRLKIVFLLFVILNSVSCTKESLEELTQPGIPVLSYPQNSSDNIGINVSLKWEKSSSENSIEYSIYYKPNQTNWILAGKTNRLEFTLNLSLNTNYSWYVSATDHISYPVTSEPYSFKTESHTSIDQITPTTVMANVESIFTIIGKELNPDLIFELEGLIDIKLISINDDKTELKFRGLPNDKLGANHGQILNNEGEAIYSFEIKYSEGFQMISVEEGICTTRHVANYNELPFVFNYFHENVNEFNISKYEVTQWQWESIMGYNPSKNKGANLPVEQISWTELHNYIIELNRKCNSNYRLPTDIEWEYAARGGNKSQGYLYAGSEVNTDVAWCKDNSDNITHPVGLKKANELGLFDMSGNVAEWCKSVTYKGGAFNNNYTIINDGFLHSELIYGVPSFFGYDIGFRLARSTE